MKPKTAPRVTAAESEAVGGYRHDITAGARRSDTPDPQPNRTRILLVGLVLMETPPERPADDVASTVANNMAAAAGAWLETLTPEQRKMAQWGAPGSDSTAEEERLLWYYTPTDHGGLPLKDQRPIQQRKAMQLVATGLSPAGYVTVCTVMGWENVLDLYEGFAATFDRERGRDPGMYYLRVFGDPINGQPWGWRFGGHHVSLNNLVIDGQVQAVTPCFIGADPASAPALGGSTLRPLAQAEDLARQLVRSLAVDQINEAMLLTRAPSDIISGNRVRVDDGDQMIPLHHIWREDVRGPHLAALLKKIGLAAEASSGLTAADHAILSMSRDPKGLSASYFDSRQRQLLQSLLAAYIGRVPEGLGSVTSLDDVHFAWAGSMEPGQPHYYRLQGPRLLIEWDNTQRGANHAHSVWRDPEADFGLDALSAHLFQHHAGESDGGI